MWGSKTDRFIGIKIKLVGEILKVNILNISIL